MIVYAAIYRLVTGAYFAAIRIAALFDNKAKLFVNGRQDILDTIRQALRNEKRKCSWMHCASLGEFEQGRPVLEELKRKYPDNAIVLTFFSPSGYEVRKDYDGADHVFYLPIDTDANAKAFLDIVRPSLCVFVKYELWYYYLGNIAARRIPAILISAVFHKEQGFFKWYGSLQRHMLRCFTHIFVQDEKSRGLLAGLGINNVSVSGDTRFDRVIKAAQHTAEIPVAPVFAQGYKILVAGSTWREDELFLHKVLSLLSEDWKLILVPHEVNGEHIADIEELFRKDVVLWSDAVKQPVTVQDKRVLLVDKVGLLLRLYRYGTVAWIGGGFGKDGVHNVLEAAVYGLPCFFGPVFHQFIEAQELIAEGGAFAVSGPEAFVALLNDLQGSAFAECSTAAKEYVLTNGGATEVVVNWLMSSKG
jgi:3-deoxy-D-manno-octulosonic-acid transferase